MLFKTLKNKIRNRNEYKALKINLSNKFNLLQYLVPLKNNMLAITCHKQKNQCVTPQEYQVEKIKLKLKFFNNSTCLITLTAPEQKKHYALQHHATSLRYTHTHNILS
ncbi:MAG: hypothetical protein D3908_05070 [Candidatus Electrothrix sp. AUS4]|nr:hypothetical protein [Candidatus Electrothrix sp. AUS4]